MNLLEVQTEERAIGGVIYRVTPLPAGKALVLSRRLAALIVPTLGDLAQFAARPSGSPVTAGDLVALVKVLDLIVDSMDDAAVVYLYETFAPTTQAVVGEKKFALEKSFDVHFQGRLVECLEWLRFCLEVNFRPLVGRLTASLQPAARAPVAPG